MKELFECKNCGEYLAPEKIEKHVKEIHFWN
jgi:ribosomal protein L32